MDQETLRRQAEGRVLKRENEVTDISQMPNEVLERAKAIPAYSGQESESQASTMQSLENIGQEEGSMSGRASSIHDQMQGDNFVEANTKADNLKQEATAIVNELVDKVEKTAKDINIQDIEQKAAQKLGNLKQKGKQIAGEIKSEASSYMKETFGEADLTKQDLREGAQNVAHGARNALNKASMKAHLAKEVIIDKVEQKAHDTDIRDIEQKASQKVEHLKQKGQQIAGEIKSEASTYFKDTFGETTFTKQSLREGAESIKQGARDTLNQASKDIDLAKDMIREEVRDTKEDIHNVQEAIVEEYKEVKQGAQGMLQKVVEKIGAWTHNVAEIATKDFNIVKETVVTEAKELKDGAKEFAEQVSEDASLVREAIIGEASDIQHGAQRIARKASEQFEKIKQAGSHYLNKAAEEVTLVKESVKQEFGQFSAEARATMDDVVVKDIDNLKGSIRHEVQDIKDGANNLARNITGKAQGLKSEIMEKAGDLKEDVDDIEIKAVNKIKEIAAYIQFQAEIDEPSQLSPEIKEQLVKVNDEIKTRPPNQPDDEVKEHLKLVNEEIRQLSPRDEIVVEAQGQVQEK